MNTFQIAATHVRNLGSLIGVATGYGLDGRGSVPGKNKIFLFSTTSRPSLGSSQPPSQWVPKALSSGVRRLGHEADLSPPSSVEATARNNYLDSNLCL
jgi:hypothetical protein